jgi:ribosomal protein S18 acetylase RimI-like enzyme
MINNLIRPLERGDLERVGYLVDINDMFPSHMLEDMTTPFFAGNNATHRWLVFDHDGVDGVAYYVPEQLTAGTWNLLLIAVDPKRHGEGIGSALMKFVEAELEKDGQRILLVETSGTSRFERTRSFYKMLGYDSEARIRDYYAAGDDKVIFRKSLA